MLKLQEFSAERAAPISRIPVDPAVSELHQRCGVYTNSKMVEEILDLVGWRDSSNLTSGRLLEPSAGDGAFVVEAARRLIRSAHRLGVTDWTTIAPCIRSYELHPEEAAIARSILREMLNDEGVPMESALCLIEVWITTGDFLLNFPGANRFTHVVGNPPYSRWSKIPKPLREKYEGALPKSIARGDIFLPFLDLGIESLTTGGKLGFLCSDRWRYMAFASDFRRSRLPHMIVHKDQQVTAAEVYRRDVDIYPSVLVMEKQDISAVKASTNRSGATLADLGFEVRVGPALGCTDAYVIPLKFIHEIEEELLAPWADARCIQDDHIGLDGRHIICLHDPAGDLRNVESYPKAHAWLQRYKTQLSNRSIVTKHGAVWFRPIDKVQASKWSGPKILLPELAKVPRVALDRGGIVPSHGIYAIMPKNPEADIEGLYNRLRSGGLAAALNGKAPKVKGEYIRCYKSILQELRFQP